jgi:hypothetical protein
MICASADTHRLRLRQNVILHTYRDSNRKEALCSEELSGFVDHRVVERKRENPAAKTGVLSGVTRYLYTRTNSHSRLWSSKFLGGF